MTSPAKVSRTLGALPEGKTQGSGCSPQRNRKVKPSDLRHKIRRLEKRIQARPDGVDLAILLRDLTTARTELRSLMAVRADAFYAGVRQSRARQPLAPFRGHTTRPYTQPPTPSRAATPGAWPTRPSRGWKVAHA